MILEAPFKTIGVTCNISKKARTSQKVGVQLMRLLLIVLFLTLISGVAPAQGGKAEPNRIQFAANRTTKTVSGSLSNGQEMEYVFLANKGQTVTIKNSTRNLFDFRVFNQEFDFETEFESSPSLTFEIPETGDYMFFVRKKQVRSPRTARFSLTLTIK